MPSGMKAERVTVGETAATPLDAALPVARLGPHDATGAHATALVFRSLGHPLRLQVIAHLHRHGSCSRSQLRAAAPVSWSTLL